MLGKQKTNGIFIGGVLVELIPGEAGGVGLAGFRQRAEQGGKKGNHGVAGLAAGAVALLGWWVAM